MGSPEPRRQTVGSDFLAEQHVQRPVESRPAKGDDDARSPSLIEPGTEPFTIYDVSPQISTSHHELHQHPGGSPFAGLSVRTEFPGPRPVTPNDLEISLRHSLSTASLPRRTPSWRGIPRNTLSSTGSLSPSSVLSSVFSSPQLAAMGDITPLPSPIGHLTSPPWVFGGRPAARSLSRTSSTISRSVSYLNLRHSDSSQLLRSASSRSRSRPYSRHQLNDGAVREDGANHGDAQRHVRNRSLSEYTPAKSVVSQPYPIAVSGAGPGVEASSSGDQSDGRHLHREQYLAVERGLALSSARPPTPPRSTQSGDEGLDSQPIVTSITASGATEEIYSVRSIRTKQSRKYRKLRQLGQGTFSQVSLAVRIPDEAQGNNGTHVRATSIMSQKLVAVKIIEYGPAGGADEERVEVSLKREVEILKSVNHPSLVQLKALGSDEKRALLVLDYCPGGDLFDFATSGVKPLSPALIRRIFAELVAAVRYLHFHYIVHRDIKLESKLLSTSPFRSVLTACGRLGQPHCIRDGTSRRLVRLRPGCDYSQ